MWHVRPTSIRVATKKGELIVNQHDFITFAGRETGVRVEKFVGDDDGPYGFEYLPWRGDRWATPTMTLKGNPRFIVCYPNGYSKFGQHIDWETVAVEQPK